MLTYAAPRRDFLTKWLGMTAGLLLATGGALRANPTGAEVVAGSATVSAGGPTLTVNQTSARAIVNWQDFSIAAGELTRFVQPDATSATLNRVVSGAPSALLGNLQANGQVFLINPNGVVIGAGARIDTAGFIASTLDVADADFLKGGDLLFTGDSTAAVQNLGAISVTGGDVFLIARQVENRGTISAANGTAGLAAGSEVLLTTGGEERVFVQAAALAGEAINSGTITAATAELKAAGGNAYALAINNSGTVRATGTAVRDGQIWLVGTGGKVLSSGTLVASSADGTRGGEVRVLGDEVTLAAGSLVDVSGSETGGVALIGGDSLGQNATVPNATATTLEAGATIRADGTDQGGRVVVWSDGHTHFAGDISGQGAKGGSIETSGHTIDLLGSVRAGGNGGLWLIDPVNITIGATEAGVIGGSLSNGTDVTITTTGAGTDEGNIIVNNDISLELVGSSEIHPTLSLIADGSITFNNTALNAYYGTGDNTASSLNVSLTAGNDITFYGFNLWSASHDINFSATATGSILFDGTSSLRTAGGSVSLVAGNGVNIERNTDYADKGIFTGGGDLTVSAGAGQLRIASSNLGTQGGDFFLNTAATDTGKVRIIDSYLDAGAGGIDIGNAAGDSIIFYTGHLTAGGDINLTGHATAVDTNANNLSGITIWQGSTITSTGGAITLTGTGMAAANGAHGIIVDASTITGSTGGVTLTGTGQGGDSSGVQINHGSSVSATGGTLKLDGKSTATAAGQNNVIGVEVYGSSLSNTGGAITILGDATTTVTGFDTGFQNHGMLLDSGSSLTASGNVTLTGTGGGRGATVPPSDQRIGNFGVNLLADVTVTGNGNITITGTGGNGDQTQESQNDGNFGVVVSTGTVQTQGTGNITITGDAGPSLLAAYGHGVLVNGGATIQTAGGDLTVTGHGRGMEGAGFVLRDGSTLATTGAGNLTIDATTQSTSTQGYTIAARFSNGLLQTENGLLKITGTNLSTASVADLDTWAIGVNILPSVTLRTTGTGDISITGTGGDIAGVNSNFGVAIWGTVEATGTGDITIAGTGGAGLSDGIYIGTAAQTAVFGTSVGATAAVVRTSNGSIALTGTSDSTTTGAHAITVDDGGSVSAGGAGTLTLAAQGTNGSASIGDVRTADHALTLTATGDVTLTGALIAGTSATLTLQPGANKTLTQTSGASIIAGTLNLLGTSATHTLTAGTNQIGYLTANTGSLSFNGDGGFAIGQTATPTLNGITATGAVNLAATGTNAYLYLNSFIHLTPTADTTLSLSAVRDLIVNQGSSITVTGSHLADVTLTSNSTGDAAGGSVFILQDSTITTNGGDLTVGGGAADGYAVARPDNADLPYGVWIATSTINTGAGDITVKGRGDNGVRLNGASLTTTSGDIHLFGQGATTGGTGVFLKAYVNDSGPTTATVLRTTSGDITLTGTANTTGSDVAGTQGYWTGVNLWTDSRDQTESNAFGYQGVYLTSASGDITLAGTSGVSVGSLAGIETTGTGAISLSSTGTTGGRGVDLAGALHASGSGAIAVDSGADIKVSGSIQAGSGTVAITADQALALSGNASISSAATGTALTLAAGTTFTNTAGASALAATNGRWLVWSQNPADDARGGLAYAFKQYNATVGTSTVLGSGNGFLYTLAPTIDVSLIGTISRIYDGTNAATVGAGNYLLVGMVDGDLVTIDVSGSGVFDTKNVGTGKVVTIGGIALDGASDGNAIVYGYQLGSTSASGAVGTITPATLTYAADPANRPYGSANPSFGGAVTGFLGGDTLANATGGSLVFTTSATIGSNIGTYSILGSGLTATDGNYVFVQAAGNATALTINPASLVITADDVSKLYGALLPTFTASYDGLVNGDTTAVVSGLTLTTTATAGSNVGTYAITAGGATASNYAITFESGTLTINPASLVITANDATREAGADNPFFTATFDGLVNGDTAAVVDGLVFGTSATTGSLIGSYAIVPSGATASNYTITFAAGTLTVIPPVVIVDGLSIPVSTLDGQSLISSGYAVVSRGRSNRFVSLSGRVAVGTSVDQGLSLALAPAVPWFGEPAGFALLPVDGDGAASQPGAGDEPRVRETSTDRGRFRVIYREVLTQERALATGNTATGSSYRDFDGARPPHVRLLRAAPSDSSATPPSTSL